MPPESDFKFDLGKPKLKNDLSCQDVEELLSQTDLSLGEQLNIARHCGNCSACEEKFMAKLLELAKKPKGQP